MTESVSPPIRALPTTTSVLSRLEAYADPKKAELQKRQVKMKLYIEKEVLAPEALSNKVNLEGHFDDLTPRERADLLYEKLMSRDQALKAIQREQKNNPAVIPEPVDAYLTSELDALWHNPETQEVFLQRYSEAIMDAKAYRLSELGGEWSTVNQAITDVEGQYRGLAKELFLGQITRPDKLSAARGKASVLAKSLIKLRDRQQDIVGLKDIPHIPENTDVAAMIMYDTLTKYHSEAKTGFVWLPSRMELHQKVKDVMKAGKFPFLIGPPGTGKSSQVEAVAKELTGESAVKIPCNSGLSEEGLIAKRDFRDNQTSYDYEGCVAEAYTGYRKSADTTPACDHGRIAFLDEMSQLNLERALAPIKDIALARPGKPFYRYIKQPTLQGSFLAGASNMPIQDERLDREFSRIPTDYFEMTKKNPELYEFMISLLLQNEGNLPVNIVELSPGYNRVNILDGEVMPDGRKIIGKQELIDDQTHKDHGTLYRFANAARALQDAYIHGSKFNEKHLANTAMYFDYTALNTGEIRITKYIPDLKAKNALDGISGERLTLSSGASTLTAETISKWMIGFTTRMQSDNPKEHVNSLSEWLKLKLEDHIAQTSTEDGEKIRAIFDHFHLFEPQQVPTASSPLTPKDIGYLSPRVPRPVILEETQHTLSDKPLSENKTQAKYQDMNVVFEDGKSRLVTTSPMEIDKRGKKTNIKSGTSFTLDGQKYKYIGYFEGKVVVDMGEGLHKLIDPGDVWEKGVFIESVAKELFGTDFIGEEAIRAMEDQCKQAGIDVQFTTDNVDLSYTREQLEEAAKEKGTDRERFLVMRPSGVKFKDEAGIYEGPITISVLYRLFKDKNPFGDGNIFGRNNYWLAGSKESANFVGQPLQSKYAMPTKKTLPESKHKSWEDQNKLLRPGEIRREAVEMLWDTIAYYSATKTRERLLSGEYDYEWVNTYDTRGYRVVIGGFSGDRGHGGINTSTLMTHEFTSIIAGLCPTK